MIGRRALLLAGSVALAGCTVVQVNLPWTPPSPLPVEPAPDLPTQLAGVRALGRHLLARADSWKLTQRQRTSLGSFDAAVDAQAAVLLSSDPGRLQRAPAPLPSVPEPTQHTAGAAYAALTSLLHDLERQHRARALAATGPAALLWAAQAAFCGTMAIRLPSGAVRLDDDDPRLTPDLHATGTNQALALCLQVAYSYEAALAAPGLRASDQRLLQQRLRAWRSLRGQVQALATAATSGPPPIGYELRPAENKAQAFALAARSESAALTVLGAWLAGTASPAERTLGVDGLRRAHTGLVTFGGAALRWPGWPR